VRLPRDLSGAQLIRWLARVGYRSTRQTGSHVRLTNAGEPEHHVTIPLHDSLRVGTLNAILSAVADAQRLSREELLQRIVD
jgi:predicted RNA binding protein YcfA (HicA-like mRNA interferase family)